MEFDTPKDALWSTDFLLLLEKNAPKPEKYEARLESFQEVLKNSKINRNIKLDDLARLVMLGSRYFSPSESKQIYFYHCDKGIWLTKAEQMIDALCLHIWPGLTRYAINEVVFRIQTYTRGSIEIFDCKMVTGVENGGIDLKTWELKPHNPDDYLRKAIPVRYDPKKDCPKIRKFLSQVTSTENIQLLEEAIGYCLWPGYEYQRAFLLFGPTQTGKSTFLKLLRAFLGPKNVLGLTLQQITSRRFGLSKIKETYANISPDMPNKMIYDTGTFKMLLADEIINADVKYGDEINFTNTAKLFFSGNIIPPTKYDDSDAYYGKWIIIDFPNQFLDNADEDLINELTTPEELSGLLNLAIAGLRRLRIRGRFEETIDLEAKKEAYLMGSDTTKAFIHTQCELEPSYSVIKSECYSEYVDFCHVSNRTPIAYSAFSQSLRKWVPEFKPTKFTIQGKRVPVYQGIRVKQSKPKRMTL